MRNPLHPKMTAAGLAGSAAVIAATILDALGVHPDPRLAALGTGLSAFAAGYLKSAPTPTTLADVGLALEAATHRLVSVVPIEVVPASAPNPSGLTIVSPPTPAPPPAA